MSKFIDKLKQLSEAAAQPIGFRTAAATESRPKMLLVASLAQADIGNPSDYLAGADAGLLSIAKPSTGAKTLKELAKAVPDIPWGVWLKGGGQGGVKQMAKSGGDFAVFPPESTALPTLQKDDETGKILAVESSLEEGLLRTVNKLPVDAVLIAGEPKKDYSLTWQHLMLFQHFADLLTKPLLVAIPSKVTADELQALLETGVGGVVIEVEAGQPAGKLQELRKLIDGLKPPSPRQPEKGEVLLPYTSRQAGPEAEED
jgi:hypothetical protein